MSDDKTPLNDDSLEDSLEKIIKKEKIKLDALEKKLNELMNTLEKYENKDKRQCLKPSNFYNGFFLIKSAFLLTCNR